MNLPSALTVTRETMVVLIPELLLMIAAMGIITTSAFVKRPRHFWCAGSAIALVAALVALLAVENVSLDAYSAVVVNDDLAFFSRLLLIITGLIVVALAHEEPSDDRAGEFFGTLLLTSAGAMLVSAANELAFLFAGLELVSIPTYLLLYLSRRNPTTREAATKYFFLSIFASGILLYGLAFLYGSAGVSNLKVLAFLIDKLPNIPQAQLALLALVLVMAGLSFRVAAVPFHFYAPDVYQGSPIVVTALLSWLPKVVGFLAMTRVLVAVFAGRGADDPIVQKAIILAWVVAAATMVWGNFVALSQENLKRLLAYSSIAHAGYLMVGIAAAFVNDPAGNLYSGIESVFYYLVVYAFMTLGTFAILSALTIKDRPVESVADLAGLARSQPLPALGLAICLLSLSGIPPLAGFWGKFEIFGSALAAERRDESGMFLLLAVIGMLSAAAGAYYYLRMVVVIYFHESDEPVHVKGGWPLAAAAGSCVGLTLLLGLFSSPLAQVAHTAAVSAMALPVPAEVQPPAVASVSDSRPISLPISEHD
jgi:NADH-quinone oxidoreductase subunit N